VSAYAYCGGETDATLFADGGETGDPVIPASPKYEKKDITLAN
jgi:hypothetical protein